MITKGGNTSGGIPEAVINLAQPGHILHVKYFDREENMYI